MYANLSLVHEALRDAVAKKLWGLMRKVAWLSTWFESIVSVSVRRVKL
jgi:hypothetical protein